MATQVTSALHQWPESTSINDQLLKNRSFLYSSCTLSKPFPIFDNVQEHESKRQVPHKKISFKIKKNPSVVYKRSHKMTAVSATTVAQLASKFNQMVENQNGRVPQKPSANPKLKQVSHLHPTNSEQKSANQTTGTVKAAIEKFEKHLCVTECQNKPTNNCITQVPKPKVPEKNPALLKPKNKKEFFNRDVKLKVFEKTERKCDSMYETLNIRKTVPPQVLLKPSRSEETVSSACLQPNTSFLWRRSSQERTTNISEDWKENYDIVLPESTSSKEEKIYEELVLPDAAEHSYEYCKSSIAHSPTTPNQSDKTDDGYEYCSKPENIYETLPALPPRRSADPLPPRPPSRNSRNSSITELVSNCYESIYDSKKDSEGSNYESVYPKGDGNAEKPPKEANYETVYPKNDEKRATDSQNGNYESVCPINDERTKSSNYESVNYSKNDEESGGSNRDSLVSSDQQSNSLYGRSLLAFGDDVGGLAGKAVSDVSSNDGSDDWEDLSENEVERVNREVIITTKTKKSKTTGWCKIVREQRNKQPKNFTNVDDENSETDHHYESLYTANDESHYDDYDSFDSDCESEKSFNKGVTLNDSGVDVVNTQLPDPPINQIYVFTRLAATAGKHMKRLKSNWTVTKTDITKSLNRMTKRKSRTDLEQTEEKNKQTDDNKSSGKHPAYENVQVGGENDATSEKSKLGKSFLNKFRRSMSMSTESANELTESLNRGNSMFYLTEAVDVDGDIDGEKGELRSGNDSGFPSSPIHRNSRSSIVRPQSPPPPIPTQNDIAELRKSQKREKRSTSWYTECGLFKNQDKRPNTYWYAEVGLYPSLNSSTPSTSSAENSGTNTHNATTTNQSLILDESNNSEFHNIDNSSINDTDADYCNVHAKETQEKLDTVNNEIQLRLQDEPLYQFYDAAISDSVCDGSVSDDSDNYEEVYEKKNRPSAMELVAPNNNSTGVTRSLWCEIPEVVNSTVLRTLSTHQMRLQEAKFEMITSEASYLNSLNVLIDHFFSNIKNSELLTEEELYILFGKVIPVKECSEKLLLDLEKCWQDNILLHGVCVTIQKHAEDNFNVYISYCENQVLLDGILRKLKEKPEFYELLSRLESSSACQSLTLYSFLMLPMQRITRWPLLIDAVLKRLSQQDDEYVSCQHALVTMNKVVLQCNEAARKMERKVEMKKIECQLEFGKGVPHIRIATSDRWLVRSGYLVHLTVRTDETILTFGKRFTKVPLHLFLFDDLLVIAKSKSEEIYTVLHYCSRNMVELASTDSIACLPFKDSQGKHLLFLTILENQDHKMVEFLFSCSSESDKERWIEALTPPKSSDPDETLYECWDCPQVTAVHNYVASQPDELTLNKGDVINVFRKLVDGWYQGERIRDGQSGWFPANYTREIANPHVRARNLKQRYRLLAYSESYLKSK